MDVTLTPELERLVRERVQRGDYTSVDELVQQAVRRLVEEEAEIAHTEMLLQEAADSGPHIELTDQEWNEMERKALEELASRKPRRAN